MFNIDEKKTELVSLSIWVQKEGEGEFSFWKKAESKFYMGGSFRCVNCDVNFLLSPEQDLNLPDKCKFDVSVSWIPLGSNDKKASDTRRLIRFITGLPSANLITKIETNHQLLKWIEFKNNCIDIAKCWLAGTELPDNPLAHYLMEGNEAHKIHHDSIWLSTKMYQNLWELLDHRHGKLKSGFLKQGWEYPFKSPRHFLEEIITHEVNSEFSVYLKTLHHESRQKHRDIATLGRKNINATISKTDKKKLDKLVVDHSQPHEWFNRLMAITKALARRDKYIKTRLDVHNDYMDGIAALQQDATHKPDLKSLGLQNTKFWSDGQLLEKS